MAVFLTYPHLSSPFPHLAIAPQTSLLTSPVIGVRGEVRGAEEGAEAEFNSSLFPHLEV